MIEMSADIAQMVAMYWIFDAASFSIDTFFLPSCFSAPIAFFAIDFELILLCFRFVSIWSSDSVISPRRLAHFDKSDLRFFLSTKCNTFIVSMRTVWHFRAFSSLYHFLWSPNEMDSCAKSLPRCEQLWNVSTIKCKTNGEKTFSVQTLMRGKKTFLSNVDSI